MGDNSQPLIFDQFDGVDLVSDKMKLSPNKTDVAKNVIGFGDSVGKRPGTSLWSATGFSGAVYEMAVQSGASAFDRLIAVIGVTETGITDTSTGKLEYVTLTSPGGAPLYTAITSTATRGGSAVEELLVCDGLMVRTGKDGSVPRKVAATGVTEANLAATPTQEYRSAELHKRAVFWAGQENAGSSVMSNMEWSDPDNAESYPAANTEKVAPRWFKSALLGHVSAGDWMYAMTNDGVHILHGETSTNFQLRRMTFPFGIMGRRATALVGGAVYGVVISPRSMKQAQAYNMRSSVTVGIVRLVGTEWEMVGTEVRSALLASTASGPSFLTDRQCIMRMQYWAEEDMLVLLTRAAQPGVSGLSEFLVRTVRPGTPEGWWPWAHAYSTQSKTVCSMLTNGPYMMLGLANGLLAYFDPTAPRDTLASGSVYDIDSYWTTCWINSLRNRWTGLTGFFKGGVKKFAIGGKQESGGPWTLSYTEDSVSSNPTYRTLAQFTPAPNGEIRSLNISGSVRSSNALKFRVEFPADGVGCEMSALGIGEDAVKQMGALE